MALTKITPEIVAVNAIQGTLIADNAITAVHIATNAVSGTLVADNAITATHIAQNVITVTQLADDAVEAAKIADGVITTNHLNKAMISSQTEVTAASGDYVLIGDTSDSNNLKKALVSDFGNDLDAAVTINESGADVDFRVESDGNANMLFVDGGNDRVGIANNAPAAFLDIATTGSTAKPLAIRITNAASTNYAWEIWRDNTDGDLRFGEELNGTDTTRVTFESGGNVGIGTTDPSRLLTVNSTGQADLTIRSGDSDYAQLMFGDQSADNRGGVLYNNSNDMMYFNTTSTATSNSHMVIDSSGKVGMGTASPGNSLDIVGSSDGNINALALRNNITGGTNDSVAMNYYLAGTWGTATAASIYTEKTEDWTSGTSASASLRFNVRQDGTDRLMYAVGSGGDGLSQHQFYTAGSERMRITSGGIVGIGTTSPQAGNPTGTGLHVSAGASGASPNDLSVFNIEDDTHVSMCILTPNTVQGQIRWADPQDDGTAFIIVDQGSNWMKLGANTSVQMTINSNGQIDGDFNDTSDVALKENISDLTGGLSIIKQLRPRNFDWKASDKKNGVAGFIAQEVESILPKEVNGEDYSPTVKGEDGSVNGITGKTLNVTGIVAHLTKAVQELETRLAALE